MPEEETITIPMSEYKMLKEALEQLSYLECWGVDNWSGYGDAMQDYYSNLDEE